MVHFAEINQAPPSYSMLQYIGSSDTETCVKKLSQILANNIDNGGRGLVSEFMWGIVGYYKMVQNLYKNWLLISKMIWEIWMKNGWKFTKFLMSCLIMDNLRQAVESPKSWKSIGYICPKKIWVAGWKFTKFLISCLNLDNLRKAVEGLKSWNSMGCIFQKKNIPSIKILYTEDLSNITFNYLSESSPNSCHFWNHKSFFTTQLVCIILAPTLHTFDKIIPSKFKF